MDSKQRRLEIIKHLQGSAAPVSATLLAGEFGVTRQIIVADIALLRAAGHPIASDTRGYTLRSNNDLYKRRIAVKHTSAELTDELYAIVDHGGTVVDVIVEHSVYGSISAALNLSSRYDVDVFVEKIGKTGASPLSYLTEGLHLHTVEVRDEAAFSRITERLEALGILLSAD